MVKCIKLLRILSLLLVALMGENLSVSAQEVTQHKVVVLETDSGRICIALYNETPLHRDNFVKLVK